MPTPAAQFSPALPWAAGTRGTITLREPVTKADLLNGALTFIDGNGMLYQPEDNDGYVDYNDTEGNYQFSIAIEDEGEVSSLQLIAPQDDNIKRVVIGPAMGHIINVNAVNDNFGELQLNEEGFIVAQCELNNENVIVPLTQDGVNLLTAKLINDEEQNAMYQIIDRQTPVVINSLLRLPAKPATGRFVGLPKLKVELFSYNNNAAFKVLHAPCDDLVDGAAGQILYSSFQTPTYWLDSVTKLFFM